MKINSATKISQLINSNKQSIDAIASINPHFKKLQNPILRKVLAPRVTIKDAARIGKCDVSDFFKVLGKLGFEIEQELDSTNINQLYENEAVLDAITAGRMVSLDVRPLLEKNKDPFNTIMKQLKAVPEHHVLQIINSFEPTPLIRILEKKGYFCHVESTADQVKTYFLKPKMNGDDDRPITNNSTSIDDLLVLKENFGQACHEIDVRDLEMPLPMVTILNELERMEANGALYVHHKKVPQFLIPELEDRKFKFHIALVDEGNVKLLIHR